MKKPTGRMGADAKDHSNHCIEIERRILDKTSSGILGASSEEDINPSLSSLLSGDDESKEESKGKVIPDTEIQPHVFASFCNDLLCPLSNLPMKLVCRQTNPRTMPWKMPTTPTPPPTLMPSPMDKAMMTVVSIQR